MAAEGKFGVLYVPDFAPGMSSFLRIGEAADDPGVSWRDHTDGNRITTTWGDKIEVIGGTYELTVYGRLPQPPAGAHADADGHFSQSGITYRGKVKFMGERIWEETAKGDVDSTFYGDTTDIYYGDEVKSSTGSETPGAALPPPPDGVGGAPADPSPGAPPVQENPEIEDWTWAQSIKSYTGSSALSIPLIQQETWVATMESVTHADSTTAETVVTGSIQSTSTLAKVVSSTTLDSMRDETTVTGNIENETTAAKIVSVTHADSDDKTYGSNVSVTHGNSKTTVDGMEKTLNIGVVAEGILGTMTDVTVGATIGGTVGASLSVKVGLEASIMVGGNLSIDLGSSVELGPADIEFHLARTEAGLNWTRVSAAHSLGV